MGFAGPSLAICKDSAIIALQYTGHNWFGCFIVHTGLCAVPVKDIVKGEGLGQLARCASWLDDNLVATNSCCKHNRVMIPGCMVRFYHD